MSCAWEKQITSEKDKRYLWPIGMQKKRKHTQNIRNNKRQNDEWKKNEAHNTNKENRTLDQMNVNSIYLNVQIRGNNSEQPQQFTRSTLNETINGGETYPDTFNIPKQEHKCQVLLKIQYKIKWRP